MANTNNFVSCGSDTHYTVLQGAISSTSDNRQRVCVDKSTGSGGSL